LGVKAVIAESFERIHRSNLVGMGVLPLVFTQGKNRNDLNLKGDELITLEGVNDTLAPRDTLTLHIKRSNGQSESVPLLCRIDTAEELEYYKNGGILQYVLRKLAA
jgi:aconitate hydratase